MRYLIKHNTYGEVFITDGKLISGPLYYEDVEKILSGEDDINDYELEQSWDDEHDAEGHPNYSPVEIPKPNKYRCIIGGADVTEADGKIVWMNIHDVIRAVETIEGSTYENVILPETVNKANIAIRETGEMPNTAPFLFDGKVYWELEGVK